MVLYYDKDDFVFLWTLAQRFPVYFGDAPLEEANYVSDAMLSNEVKDEN